MAKITVITGMILLLLPGLLLADSAYFRGTRTGWSLTDQVFEAGRYKEYNLFIVIGAGPTTRAIHTISGWKSGTTYLQDLSGGVDTFGEQMSKSATSIADNLSELGKSAADLFVDPVREVQDFSLITPASIIFKTVVNVIRIGWNSVILVGEPVLRVGGGTVALVGAPLIKPATYAGVALAYTGTALYGYGSSTVAGAVMLGATGTVLALDIATTPAVAVYEAMQPEDTTEPVSDDDNDGKVGESDTE